MPLDAPVGNHTKAPNMVFSDHFPLETKMLQDSGMGWNQTSNLLITVQ